jgi:hypothetical protein
MFSEEIVSPLRHTNTLTSMRNKFFFPPPSEGRKFVCGEGWFFLERAIKIEGKVFCWIEDYPAPTVLLESSCK